MILYAINMEMKTREPQKAFIKKITKLREKYIESVKGKLCSKERKCEVKCAKKASATKTRTDLVFLFSKQRTNEFGLRSLLNQFAHITRKSREIIKNSTSTSIE